MPEDFFCLPLGAQEVCFSGTEPGGWEQRKKYRCLLPHLRCNQWPQVPLSSENNSGRAQVPVPCSLSTMPPGLYGTYRAGGTRKAVKD